jgi:hypothetical protein
MLKVWFNFKEAFVSVQFTEHLTAVINSEPWEAEAVFLVVCDPSMNKL